LIFLLLSVLASTLIFVTFKLFERFKINILQAIVANYWVAFSTAIIAYRTSVSIAQLPQFGWFYYALALGALFILVFNLMAITTQQSGLSVVSELQRFLPGI